MTREEAIIILKNEQPHCGKRALFPEEKKYEAYDVAIKALEQEPVFYPQVEGITPTVVKQEPTIEAYKQVCKERDIAIEQLHELGYEWGQKIEPCGDAISRQAALKLFATHDGHYLYDAIRDLPSVTPKQRTGHWIQAKRPFNFRFKCSECGRPALKSERNGNDVKSKYCPRCGARMEREEQA